MTHTVCSTDPITLVGGGPLFEGSFDMAISLAPQVFAADGGADAVIAQGVVPAMVFGDFDSLSPKTRDKVPPQSLCHVFDQDSTDFEKAISRLKAPLILGVGFTGGRIDHELAVLHGLLRFAHQHIVLVGEHEVICHAPPRLMLDLPADATVSIFPLRQTTGQSTGLKWAIDDLVLEPGGIIGTSNAALGGPVDITIDHRGALLFFPRCHLQAVMQALRAGARDFGQWPALE